MMSQEFPDSPILIVDDEPNFLNSLEFDLSSQGVTNVAICQDSREVMGMLEANRYSVIVLDISMPHITGDELLPKIVKRFPTIPIIIMTAYNDSKINMESLAKGAFDCLRKPADSADLIRTIKDALELKEINLEINQSKKRLFADFQNGEKSLPLIITQTHEIKSICESIGLIAYTSRPVLIEGEVGSGKEFLAQEIHRQSHRKGNFEICQTHGMAPEELENLIFRCSTAFRTNEICTEECFIEKAQRGTLFIDDVADLSLDTQSKLYRVLKYREYSPIGSTSPRTTNIRIVAASSVNLIARVQVGSFHKGLYEILRNHEIHIPSLRDRQEDIPLLLDHFLDLETQAKGLEKPIVPKSLLHVLENYNFPGNISELKKMVSQAVERLSKNFLPLDVFVAQTGQSADLSFDEKEWPKEKQKESTASDSDVIFKGRIPSYSEMEAAYMDEVVNRTGQDLSAAARLTGLTQKTFMHYMKKTRKFNRKIPGKNT